MTPVILTPLQTFTSMKAISDPAQALHKGGGSKELFQTLKFEGGSSSEIC